MRDCRIIRGIGDGREWKKRPDTIVIDFHDGEDHGFPHYEAHLEDFRKRTMKALREAQKEGNGYVCLRMAPHHQDRVSKQPDQKSGKLCMARKEHHTSFGRIALIMVLPF